MNSGRPTPPPHVPVQGVLFDDDPEADSPSGNLSAEALPRQRTNYPPEVKRRALELFNMGCGYKRTSFVLGIPAYTVRDWNRRYKENRFCTESDDGDPKI